MSCRNKHWSQYFNRILISSTGHFTICPAIVVQAALDSRAACTTMAEHIEVEPADEIKIRLKHCGQCLFLQYMLSASIFIWIFDFQIWIPIVHCVLIVHFTSRTNNKHAKNLMKIRTEDKHWTIIIYFFKKMKVKYNWFFKEFN